MNRGDIASSVSRRTRRSSPQVTLARLANVRGSLLRDFEKGRRKPTTNELEAIRRALEAKGVIFGEGTATARA